MSRRCSLAVLGVVLGAVLGAAALTGCGCGRWDVTLPGGATFRGSEACGYDHGAELEYRASVEQDYVVDLGTWHGPPELDTLLNKVSVAPADMEVEGPVPFEATLSWSDGDGTYEAALVDGVVEVIRPRETVLDPIAYDEVTLAWDLRFDGDAGLAGSFEGKDVLRVVQP